MPRTIAAPPSPPAHHSAPASEPDALARLIPIEDVAKLLGVCERSVSRLDAAGKMPSPRRIGRAKRWDADELRAWLSRPKHDGKLMSRSEWAPVWAQIVRTKSK